VDTGRAQDDAGRTMEQRTSRLLEKMEGASIRVMTAPRDVFAILE
jgi:hypothetical protein